MTILSLADSCRLLAIDAKTLHHWLRLAHISVQAHPFDGRLKCVTSEHVQQLATTHRRLLPELSEGPITQLTQQLGSLQAQVALLQQQLALLTEHLQKERQGCTSVIKAFENTSLDKAAESSLDKAAESSLDKAAESSLDKPAESSLDKAAESSLDKPAESSLDKAAIPASIDRRKHPRVLPLVEYGVQGNYVVISPEEGLLSFEPDSPEWFAWLSTLPSFRFVGQQGRFTGLTASVTIASLELAATSLQALV